jgi:hypothetical protein
MPGPPIVVEDDPTPLVRAMAADLERRLGDPEFAGLTEGLTGIAAVRAAGTPEAATFELGAEAIALRHGAAGAEATATLGPAGRWDGEPVAGEEEHPALASWLRALAAPPETPWREAAAAFWAQLEGRPGAPGRLVIAELASGESEEFGAGEPAYEIRAPEATLVALLEGRAAVIAEAFDRRAYIRGSFPAISVLAGAAARVRMDATFTRGDA